MNNAGHEQKVAERTKVKTEVSAAELLALAAKINERMQTPVAARQWRIALRMIREVRLGRGAMTKTESAAFFASFSSLPSVQNPPGHVLHP